jgi:hypothetical protein
MEIGNKYMQLIIITSFYKFLYKFLGTFEHILAFLIFLLFTFETPQNWWGFVRWPVSPEMRDRGL